MGRDYGVGFTGLILMGLLWLIFVPIVEAQIGLTLFEGTTVHAKMDVFVEPVLNGSRQTFKLSQDLMENGHVAFPVGTVGYFQIESVKNNGRLGKAGSITYGKGVIDPDGAQVPVRLAGASVYPGKGKLGKGLMYFVVGVFFVKGEIGGIPPGQEFTMVIDKDKKIISVK